jgi:exodeoxyribonuclease V alpha subunit
VETGVVFAEVCAARGTTEAHRARIAQLVGAELPEADAAGAAAFRDAVVWLTRSYRFTGESGIGRLARSVNAGDTDGALKLLAAGAFADITWAREAPGSRDLAGKLIEGFAPFMEAIRRGASPEEILSGFDRYRVLCALREGEFGARHLSAEIGVLFRQRLGQAQPDAGRWYAGRPVLVTRNDYALRVFNGDVGVALPDAAGNLLVHFPVAEGGTRSIAPSRLADCETAFAMTVHKAQGSEFDRADLVLPAYDSRVLTRELIYTALTRSRSALTVWGPEEILRAAINRPTARVSGLGERLRGIRNL